mmetsp:Transcript_11405/g.17111  ORF Transcript_11405/g.17111 Transcript_11405/m.17111 type:complete len:136 (+) Transcript_11405:527-934(+)
MDLQFPPNVKNPAPMKIIFMITVHANAMPVNFFILLGVFSFKSSQKSCAEKCTSKEVAHMETNTRMEGDSALFPTRPKDGREIEGMEFKKTLPAVMYGEVGRARRTMNMAVMHIPVTPTILTGESAANDLSLQSG